MKNIFRKKPRKLVKAKVRISALFNDNDSFSGSYLLKSGLRRIPGKSPIESQWVVDFQEPITWTKSINEAEHITIYGLNVVHINEQLNYLMVDFIRNYDMCYKSTIHPFYVITDMEYSDEKLYEMEFEYTCDSKSELKPGEITPWQVFKSINESYFSGIVEHVEDGFNFKVKLVCRMRLFDCIKAEFLSILAGKDPISDIEIIKNTKRKCIINDHRNVTIRLNNKW